MALWGGELPQDLLKRLGQAIQEAGITRPLSPLLLALVISGMGQVRNMERIARALSSRGVPVWRDPIQGYRDRYAFELLDPSTSRVYRLSAPISEPSQLVLSGENYAARMGRPSEVFWVVRRLLGLGR